MADIDSIIAGGAKTNADFSQIGNLNKSYWEGLDQNQKQKERDVFAGVLPQNADGSPNYAEMSKNMYQLGNIDKGNALSTLDIQRRQLALGEKFATTAFPTSADAGPAQTLPPSTSRNGSVVVAPPTGQAQAKPPAQNLMQHVAATGIPNDQLGEATTSIARQLGIQDPSQPIDINDPRVRNVLVPALQQLKQAAPAAGQVQPQAQQQQPQAAQVQPQQAPQQPAPAPQQMTGTPISSDPTLGGLVPAGRTPQQQIELLSRAATYATPAQAKVYEQHVKAIQDAIQPTTEMKNTAAGMANPKIGEYQTQQEAAKTAAVEEAKLGAKRYETIIDNGTKAQQEIPQLQLMQEQMNDPNFFSGAGEKYNLLYKRLKSAVGIDPDAAVPQEMLRKVTSANILSGLGALKGLGQIRVAEINLAKDAAASPDNSVPANKFLIETSKRTHERNSEIADMAQAYKEKNGTLDAGFDKQVSQFYKKNPLYSDAEVKDWHKIIGEAKQQPNSQRASNQGKVWTDQFASPAAAKAAGVQRGDTITGPDGKPWVVK